VVSGFCGFTVVLARIKDIPAGAKNNDPTTKKSITVEYFMTGLIFPTGINRAGPPILIPKITATIGGGILLSKYRIIFPSV
jgi:hypothetical protein